MRNRWTEDEIITIQNNYINLSDKELMSLIPNHSQSAIATKRKHMGLHRTNRKYTFEDVLETCNERDYILLSTEFISCANNIEFICNKHKDKGVQHITYGHMLEGKGCYWCGREKTEQAHRNMVSLQQKMDICSENGLEYVGFNYENNLLNIEFICTKHRDVGVQTMRYQNMRRGICGCRYCAKEKGIVKSKGEQEIIDILQQYGIDFVEQKIYHDCKDTNYLPFDFYLPSYNTLIEFDGEQHYFPVRFHGMDEQDAKNNFVYVKKHDEIKNEFCAKYNIPLIRVPYTERGNIELFLIDKFKKLNIL
jgi:hypothetical protein